METKSTYTSTAGISNTNKRIAVVSMNIQLGNETCGSTRFRYISELLCKYGYKVDLITTNFQHAEKKHRQINSPCYSNTPYSLVFLEEPGYKTNFSAQYFISHKVLLNKCKAYFNKHIHDYDLIYIEMPSNDIAYFCTKLAYKENIPTIVDINTLWPEELLPEFNIQPLRNVLFHPCTRHAKKTYQLISGAVGTSQEYARRPMLYRNQEYPYITVYIGNDLALFDAGVARFKSSINKNKDEFWVSYAGSLAKGYDLPTLIEAGALLKSTMPNLRIRIMGDGPNEQELKDLAQSLKAPVDFLGRIPYEEMAAELACSDAVINSLVAHAPQSIIAKIGDYLASQSAMINTGSNPELRCKVNKEKFGINVISEDPKALAKAISDLASDKKSRLAMSKKAREIAESQFNQAHSYKRIVEFIHRILVKHDASKTD